MPKRTIYILPRHLTGANWHKHLVQVPAPPSGMHENERHRIERLARRAVKRGYRPRAEDYPVPPWVAKSRKRKEYYLARLEMELALRRGYREARV